LDICFPGGWTRQWPGSLLHLNRQGLGRAPNSAETVVGDRYLARLGGTLYAHEELELLADTIADCVNERAVRG
jgi:hypothetical protein